MEADYNPVRASILSPVSFNEPTKVRPPTNAAGENKGLEATIDKLQFKIKKLVAESLSKQPSNPDPNVEATLEISDAALETWRDVVLTANVYTSLKRPLPPPVEPTLNVILKRVTTMLAEEVKLQLQPPADARSLSETVTQKKNNIMASTLFGTMRRAPKALAGITDVAGLLERFRKPTTSMIVEVANAFVKPPPAGHQPVQQMWGFRMRTGAANGAQEAKSPGFGGMNIFAKRKAAAAEAADRRANDYLADYFPHKGTVKQHLIKLGILTPRDHMRTDRRMATDVGAMEDQQKRMKDLAARFWSKTDEERAFIKQTFDTWHVDASSTDLRLDGRSVTEQQYEVLEDIFEIGHYKFSSLSMKKCYLQDADLTRIASMLETNTFIKKVDWCKNLVTEKSMAAVADLITYNRTLTEIDLRDNPHITTEGGIILAKALPHNKTLKVLNGIPVGELMDPRRSDRVDMTKRRLCQLEAALLSRLLPTLPSCQRLSTLLLNDNHFTFRAMDVLLEALQQLPSLRTLDLSGNRIGVEGAEAAAYFLFHNKTLTSLSMVDCDLCMGGGTMRGVELLASVMTHNRTLLHMDLSDNQAKAKVVSRIQDSLRVNHSLLCPRDSHEGFESFISSTLPDVPEIDLVDDDGVVPPYDEPFLIREKYHFRTFAIDPEVEDVTAASSATKGRKKKNLVTSLLAPMGGAVVSAARGLKTSLLGQHLTGMTGVRKLASTAPKGKKK